MTTETLPILEKIVLVNQDGSLMAVNKRDTEPALYPQDNVIKYQGIFYVQDGNKWFYFARVKVKKQ